MRISTENRKRFAADDRWRIGGPLLKTEHAGLTCYTLLSPSITFHCFTLSSKPTFSENLILHLSLFLSVGLISRLYTVHRTYLLIGFYVLVYFSVLVFLRAADLVGQLSGQLLGAQ